MSSVLKGFILFAILIGVTGIVPAFALNPVLLQNYTNPTTTGIANTSIPQITVTTDKSSYNDGDKITIYGTTSDYISGTPVTVQIRNPIGNVVGLNQVEVGTDKTYSITLTAGGSLWQSAGTYSIFVEFGSQDRTAQTTFQFFVLSLPKVPNTI